jgi:hypothetical protein
MGSQRTTNNSSSNQNTSQQTSPWAPQAGVLTEAMGEARRIYGANAGQNPAPDNFVAGFNPHQLNTFQRMINYGNGNNVAATNEYNGAALSNAGMGGINGALSGYANFDPSASNNPGALIAAANQYASGQDIDAQVNNAMLNARQTARDVTLPGISQNAARSHNTNSSRTGIAEGMVTRGLAQQATDLGASLRSKAFSDGLSLASNNAQANNAANLSRLSGMASLGSNAFDMGRGALSGSLEDAARSFGLAGAGAEGLRAADQAGLDNALARYEAGQNAPWGNLRNYMDIIGSQVYGQNSTGTQNGTSTATQTQSPSGWQIAGGLLGAGTSLFGSGGFNILGGLGRSFLGGR